MECARIYAKVDLDAIDKNVCEMQKLQPEHTPIFAVIKTNAYGHGAIEIARHLEKNPDVFGFAVATAEEAMELRHADIKKTILILGYVFEKDYKELILNDIRLCVFRYDMAQAISDCAGKLKKKAYIHIKIDTGMGRIGFLPNEKSISEITAISNMPYLEAEGIFTHFARADETDKTSALLQFDKFRQVIAALERNNIRFALKHCANSAAILSLPQCHMDTVRAGITLYGLHPSEEEGPQYTLHPALSLYSRIVHLKEISPGDSVSYGGTYRATEKRIVATIPVGYGDGYPRSLSNIGSVLIRGKRANIIGRICMDQLMVDVTDIPEASLLDEVVLLGNSGDDTITMEELGKLSGRFNYELACDLGNRIPRFYYSGGRQVAKLDYFA